MAHIQLILHKRWTRLVYALIFICIACSRVDVVEIEEFEEVEIDDTYITNPDSEKNEADKGDDDSDTKENVDGNKENDGGNSDEDRNEYNLLTNGDLETWVTFWTPERPKGWSLPSNEYVKRNSAVVYSGSFSAKMQSLKSGETARLEQKIEVKPGNRIRIRFHFFIEQWKAKGARTYCYFRTNAAEKYNIPTGDLKEFYGEDAYRVIRGGGYGLTYFPSNTNIWQAFDETVDVPPTATWFVFGINSYYGITIFIDDCWILDVTQ